MRDLHEISQQLNGVRDDVVEAIEFLNEFYRDAVCAWLRKRVMGLQGNRLALAWKATLKEFVEACQQGRVPQDWFRPSPLGDPVEFALRRCALAVTENPTTTDVDALTAVGEVFLTAGFNWRDLPDEARKAIRLCIRQRLQSADERVRLVWKSFAGGYPHTKSRFVLQKRLAELDGVPMSEREIQHAFDVVRLRLREDISSILVSAKVEVEDEQ